MSNLKDKYTSDEWNIMEAEVIQNSIIGDKTVYKTGERSSDLDCKGNNCNKCKCETLKDKNEL